MLKRKHNQRGFTLIEIIVVLLIMSVLMSVAVPSVSNYIGEGDKASTIAITREVYIAAQSATVKAYADDNATYTACINRGTIKKEVGYIGTKASRISNNALYRVQHNSNVSGLNTVDRVIAASILTRLNGSSTSTSRFNFTTSTGPTAANTTVKSYETKEKMPGINVTYGEDGNVIFVEVGYKDYLAHFRVSDQKMTVTYNGTYSTDPVY